MSIKKIFWIAGENSGDLHASFVLKSLNSVHPDFINYGIGGPRMKCEGFKALYPFERFIVMGFAEVIHDLSFFLKIEKKVKRILLEEKPDLIILVDYPGFNLRIAKAAYNMDIPVLYYISPQFWAWKHSRVRKLYEYTNHVACILPFEQELLEIHRVNCSYVGHPITEEINIELDKKKFAEKFRLNPDKSWIGFLPGSRNLEIKKILPEFLKAIALLRKTGREYEFLISKSYTVDSRLFREIFDKFDPGQTHIISGYTHSMISNCDFLAATSGTVTIEIAYIGTPFLIAYKANNTSYQIAKRLIKLPYIGLPNIILNKKAVPELIQNDLNPDNIQRTISNYTESRRNYNNLKLELMNIQNLLSEKKPSVEVLKLIEKLVFPEEIK